MSTTPIPMLDLMFFLTESVENPRHVGSVLIFKRPPRGGANTAREIFAAYRASPPQPPFNRIPVFRKTGPSPDSDGLSAPLFRTDSRLPALFAAASRACARGGAVQRGLHARLCVWTC